MSLWDERAGRNEALFREVNEQARTLADRFGGPGANEFGFVCECSDDACTERVRLTLEVYEAVRASPRRFVLVAGHETSVERVVDRGPGYVIVEKVGAAARIAEQHDPRA
jgi:hypothetical protein